MSRSRLLLLPLLAGVGCDVAWGDLPVRCDATGACPDGYECIRGVCAAPGTEVPATLAALEFLRPTDLRVLPLDGEVLVAWESYAYGSLGQKFLGTTLGPDWAVGEPVDLVSTFVADEGAVEPYFDLVRSGADQLLLAVSASPLPDDEDPSPRLLVYRVELGASVTFQTAWAGEKRLPTIGYGAVSAPAFAPAAGGGWELGYVQTRTDVDAQSNAITLAELVRFQLDADGADTATLAPVPARTLPGLPLAIGVAGAWEVPSARDWVLDRDRPSLLRIDDMGASTELALQPFASVCEAGADGLVYVAPSPRDGVEPLPSAPASQPAALRRVGPGGADELVGELPVIRDTPAPVCLPRGGSSEIVVSMGAAVDDPEIHVHGVDPQTGAVTTLASIQRLGDGPVSALRAAILDGQLYVVWAEENDEAIFLRAAIVTPP